MIKKILFFTLITIIFSHQITLSEDWKIQTEANITNPSG